MIDYPNHRVTQDDLLWPVLDQEAYGLMIRELDHLSTLIGLVNRRGVAVQAGGATGLWPLHLAQHFDAVYTFEPEWQNFVALVANCRLCGNVFPIRAALGSIGSPVSLDVATSNAGGHRVRRGLFLNRVPEMRIDDLCLEYCDLIALDVEGSELAAVAGAAGTICRCGPVVAFEERGLGPSPAAALIGMGYRDLTKIGYDRVMTPRRQV